MILSLSDLAILRCLSDFSRNPIGLRWRDRQRVIKVEARSKSKRS